MNKVILMGRVVNTPELRHTKSNIPVSSFSLAVQGNYNKTTGERSVDFIDVVAWRSNAEFVSKYFSRGRLMVVSGSIHSREYEDRDGNKRRTFEVLADDIYFAGYNKEGGASAPV